MKIKYSKVIFVSTENTARSPLAEGIFRSITDFEDLEIMSRGTVVLFDEPCNPKVTQILKQHKMDEIFHKATQLVEEDIDDSTLIITMTFAEKVKVLEDFPNAKNVYILKEYVNAQGEVDIKDPYGGDMEQYELCFDELRDLLYQMKLRLEEEE